MPQWWPQASVCRWEETLALYRGLASSSRLPDGWRRKAAARFKEMSARVEPGRRPFPQPCAPEEVLAVCMEPMFEALVALCESTAMQSLGVTKRPPGWPHRWADPKVRQPDRETLQAAIKSARHEPGTRGRSAFRQIRGDMLTRKHEWGEYLLRQLLTDARCAEELRQHPIARRLRTVLGSG